MKPISVSFRNLLFRPVLTVSAVAILGMAVGIATAVFLLASAIEQGLIRASDPFDLLVGAKGSDTQLIMSTVLLQDAPIGNIPLRLMDDLRDDPRVAHVTPLAMGDSIIGTPIIGTDESLFRLARPATGETYFQIEAGRLPELGHDEGGEENAGEEAHGETWEGVAGAAAADIWPIGSGFQSQHGGIGSVVSSAHDTSYEIVGRLRPTGTPMDRAIFVPVESYWESHQTADAEREVTVLMVRPIGIAGFYQIHMEINQGTEAQAVLTGQGMSNLFDILGQGSAILGLVSYMTLLMGAGTVFIVAYAAGAQRTRETAVLRALGAGRWFVSGIAISESLLLAAFGCIAGLAAGHLTALTIASRIRDASAIAVQPGILWETELLLFVAMLLLAAAGLLPALQTYRQDVAASLASV